MGNKQERKRSMSFQEVLNDKKMRREWKRRRKKQEKLRKKMLARRRFVQFVYSMQEKLNK